MVSSTSALATVSGGPCMLPDVSKHTMMGPCKNTHTKIRSHSSENVLLMV